ncbi:MAG: hypothetical protein A2150_07775 [Candidatus Muproteobacteria bacterium RBG_16_64_11]|uniref:Uncharacterized protein n=1 Tax=Candidatus Muproteobacteria bacterium RBG_16_64_11 TaxID=1817758 RepID=A0A1F6TFC7_9PROT|nr:MAG: hypothetical protein A2150_07775 [Candidatus Muproteobacteria bacterium RBG_16_64_11]
MQAGSPSIDQATATQPLTVPDDYDLIARPQGVRADIGAYEYDENTPRDTLAPAAPANLSVQ